VYLPCGKCNVRLDFYAPEHGAICVDVYDWFAREEVVGCGYVSVERCDPVKVPLEMTGLDHCLIDPDREDATRLSHGVVVNVDEM